MILSVSRRTDIPACYGGWFYNRIRAGFVQVRNPYNPRQVSHINLKPEAVDCIVFWTKNPGLPARGGGQAFMDGLPLLDGMGYKYYFQFTVTSYNRTIEPGVPRKKAELSAQTVNDIESCRTWVSDKPLIKLAEALHTTPADLLVPLGETETSSLPDFLKLKNELLFEVSEKIESVFTSHIEKKS